MHVLYIMGQDSGGLPHYTAELANAVSNHTEVTVLKASKTSADELIDPKVNVLNLFDGTEISMQNIFNLKFDPKNNIMSLLSYRNIKLINQIDPDIVHDPTDEFPQVSLFSLLYRVYRDRPYIVTVHEVEHGGSQNRLLDLVNKSTRIIPDFPKDAAVVHSEEQKELLKCQDRNIESLYVIPHGVYTFFCNLDYTEREEKENHALFFGSLIPPKGLKFLIEAVPDILNEIPDFTLTIAGNGSLPKQSEHIVEQSDAIEVRNEFIPNDEVGTLFTEAQLITLPYRKGWQTGHSGTLSTAFAFGKPVITTDVGDFQKMVGDKGAGLVVEPESAESLANGIINILSDDKKRLKMANSSSQVAEELSWKIIGKKHIEMYSDILNGN